MYQVFNMGHRMEIYTDEASAKGMIDIAKGFNIDAQIVGYTEKNEVNKLEIHSPDGPVYY